MSSLNLLEDTGTGEEVSHNEINIVYKSHTFLQNIKEEEKKLPFHSIDINDSNNLKECNDEEG